MKQKLCAALVLLCMLVTLLPGSIWAQEAKSSDTEVEYSVDGGSTWNESSLIDAIFACYTSETATIRLKDNIILDASWYAPILAYSNRTVTMDGNGFTIYRGDAKTAFFQ